MIDFKVDLKGHTKAVTCLSFEPAGNRIVTGSLDYTSKLFDFGGMDARHKFFNSIEAHESHPVSAISHSPSGDRFIVGTGSTQPIIFDREGNEIIKFVRGDMYLRDLTNTKGHTMEVTGVHWHPVEKNLGTYTLYLSYSLNTTRFQFLLLVLMVLYEFGIYLEKLCLVISPTNMC